VKFTSDPLGRRLRRIRGADSASPTVVGRGTAKRHERPVGSLMNRRGGDNVPIAPAAEAAEFEDLKVLLVEIVERLVEYEPDALSLLDRLTAPPGSVSDARRAA